MEGKVIPITGAASGIGLATAKLLASKGAIVSIADVQKPLLDIAADDIMKNGGTVMAAVVDVRNREQVEDWIKETVNEFGRLDGAANIAGVGGKTMGQQAIEDINDEDWDFIFDVNVKGVMNCLRYEHIFHTLSKCIISNIESVHKFRT